MIVAVAVNAQTLSSLHSQQTQVAKQKAALQAQIDQLSTQILKKESVRKDILDDLKQSEKAISEISRKLDRLLDEEQAAKENLLLVEQEEKIQKQVLDTQIEEFSDQLFAQYVSNISPWTALLSGKDVQKISRDLSYLGYISRARAKVVQDLHREIDRLTLIRKKTQQRKERLAKLTQEAQQTKRDLEKEQKLYQVKLSKIESELNTRRQQAKLLKADEDRLNSIIEGIENNIRAQREALRQAEIRRQKLAEEQRHALVLERERKAAQIQAQVQAAQSALIRTKEMQVQARQAQLEAIAKQQAAIIDVQKAQEAFNFANLSLEQEEAAKTKLQQALEQQKRAEQVLITAREQAENAEIERAKARLAQEKAREAQRLLQQAKEDEQRAQQEANIKIGQGLHKGVPWPLRGRLLGHFGQTRPDTGDIWRGILINAVEGAPVRAIASGHIVFADWMRGFGNLTIIDHGNHYLSIYGYNQSVTRQVGDSVKAGDIIAHAGATGGQVEPALYFEIRQGTTPVNPLQWLAQ